MLLSVITVAFRNLDGVVKTWRSLRNLARDPSLSFEWIVVDGGSNDGTAEFLEKLNGEFNLRYVSEKDRGIYDAMNKGIDMAQGRYAIFLNSGDIFHEDVAQFVRQLARVQGNAMILGDALLDFGDGNKVAPGGKTGLVYLSQLAGQPPGDFLPRKWIKNVPVRTAISRLVRLRPDRQNV